MISLFYIFRVRGDSMNPTFHSGDWIFVRRIRGLPKVGAIVAVRDPIDTHQILVKRVSSLGLATFAVTSDNILEGRDSRHFGSLERAHLIGQVFASWPYRK
ncbi:MAG: S26 family signal peptidase [Myxococcales bacterium]|nr:S26 family signal peptidase [Myxococcales bacterium]